MLKFQNVCKSFNKKIVLNSVNLDLEANRTHVLLGPSGCGKSTLLKLTMGLITPDSGTITINNTLVAPQSAHELRKKIGYVLQNGGLFPHFTAKKNLELVARLNGWDEGKTLTRTKELADMVSLDQQLLNKFPQQLSGGQQQRVGLMRALFLDPPILLFDEALSALDPLIRRELQEELVQIFESLNKTVVFVTHDVSEAAILAHTVTLLHEGRLAQHGRLDQMINEPKDDFVTTFLSAQRPPKILEQLH